MENKYQAGKIYKIINPEMPGLVYYGSTIRTLKHRMSQHKTSFKYSKKCCSKALFEYGTPDIILIENYPCNSEAELNRKEGEYQLGNDCINKNIAGRTESETKKIYYENNKDIYKKNHKCECGSIYTSKHKNRHFKTKKHQAFISSN